ncbi:uncharacterized protein TNCV_2003221 [Trichonephila clavipes]|nr:uncharacterized protein TNCV_2003221 [Trichonephila clavipes]
MEVPLRTAYGQNGRYGMQPKARQSSRAGAAKTRTETCELVEEKQKLLDIRAERERRKNARDPVVVYKQRNFWECLSPHRKRVTHFPRLEEGNVPINTSWYGMFLGISRVLGELWTAGRYPSADFRPIRKADCVSRKNPLQNTGIVRVQYFAKGGFVGYRSRASSKHLSPHLPVDELDSSGGQTGVALHLQDARVGVGSTKSRLDVDVRRSDVTIPLHTKTRLIVTPSCNNRPVVANQPLKHPMTCQFIMPLKWHATDVTIKHSAIKKSPLGDKFSPVTPERN